MSVQPSGAACPPMPVTSCSDFVLRATEGRHVGSLMLLCVTLTNTLQSLRRSLRLSAALYTRRREACGVGCVDRCRLLEFASRRPFQRTLARRHRGVGASSLRMLPC